MGAGSASIFPPEALVLGSQAWTAYGSSFCAEAARKAASSVGAAGKLQGVGDKSPTTLTRNRDAQTLQNRFSRTATDRGSTI